MGTPNGRALRVHYKSPKAIVRGVIVSVNKLGESCLKPRAALYHWCCFWLAFLRTNFL